MTERSAMICLGTVKLGVPDYGFSSSPPVRDFDPLAFLTQAVELGVRRFDTSPRYGESEEILGRYLAQTPSQPLISSKIDNLRPANRETPAQMLETVRSSLQRLNLNCLDLCYLHQNELEILSDPYVHEGLRQLKELGLIRSAGASLYSFDECDYALGSGQFDLLQVPVSLFDLGFYQRFIVDNRSGVRFAARSLLLQGLLVNRSGITGRIRQSRQVHDYLRQLDDLGAPHGLSPVAMALGFVAALPGIDHYLIGTTSLGHLQQDLQFFNSELPPRLQSQLAEMAILIKDWSNPRNWVAEDDSRQNVGPK